MISIANHGNIVDSLFVLGKYQVAQDYIKKALNSEKNQTEKSNLYFLASKTAIYQSQYQQAIEYAFESKKIAKINKDKLLYTKNDYLLGQIFLIINDKEKAQEYFDKVIQNIELLDTFTKIKTYYALSFFR